MKALVIDDDPLSRGFMKHIFEQSGHFVEIAGSAEEALPVLARTPFDLILLDIWLPGMSGLQLCRWVRGRVDGADSYIIIATSRQAETGVADALKVGADDFLEKPCTPEMLKARVAVAERRIAINTERRRAESERNKAVDALRLSERRFRQLFERNLAGVFRSTVDGRFLDCNDAFARFIGCASREQALEVPAAELYVHAEDRDQLLAEVRAAGSVINREVKIRRRDGKVIWTLASVTHVLHEDGQPEFLEGTILDISEQKSAARAQIRLETERLATQKDRSLAILAGGVAHDFNNLLVGILGYAEMSLDLLDPASRAHGYVKNIEAASIRAATITRQMLAYVGGGRYVIQPIDLSTLVRDLADLLTSATGSRATLEFTLASGLPSVSGDASQLQQILVNLVNNATEAVTSPSDVIRISTGCARFQRNDFQVVVGNDLADVDHVYLKVTDTGHGISSDIIAQIFDPFFSTKFPGRGLGLAATFGIVRTHGGAVAVRSSPESGSDFTVWLPPIST